MRRATILLLLLQTACVDRELSVRERRARFDRSALAADILPALPAGLEPAPAEVQGLFGGQVRLLSVVLEPEVPSPGNPVRATFYFEVVEEPDEDFRIFVHLDDRRGTVERIVADHAPVGGAYPTSVWRKGEVVRDVFRFHVPPYTAPGTSFELWMGLFARDERLPLTNRASVRADAASRLLATAFVAR